MSWLLTSNHLPRVPEPEIMDDAGEVEAYRRPRHKPTSEKLMTPWWTMRCGCYPCRPPAPAAPPVHHRRNAIADRNVVADRARVAARHRNRSRPDCAQVGSVPSRLAPRRYRPLAQHDSTGRGRVASAIVFAQHQNMRGPHVSFLVGDAGCLPFRDATFELVLCNSVLHHLDKPASLLAEIARVAKPGGAILVRDLRRPSRIAYPLHVRWYGRHYSGLMYKLFCDSVRAAYTADELAVMLRTVSIPGARIFAHGRTHLGFDRPAG